MDESPHSLEEVPTPEIQREHPEETSNENEILPKSQEEILDNNAKRLLWARKIIEDGHEFAAFRCF